MIKVVVYWSCIIMYINDMIFAIHTASLTHSWLIHLIKRKVKFTICIFQGGSTLLIAISQIWHWYVVILCAYLGCCDLFNIPYCGIHVYMFVPLRLWPTVSGTRSYLKHQYIDFSLSGINLPVQLLFLILCTSISVFKIIFETANFIQSCDVWLDPVFEVKSPCFPTTWILCKKIQVFLNLV